jgi:hypothetical protein
MRLGGLDLSKILKGVFLESLVLPKILKVGGFSDSMCLVTACAGDGPLFGV